MQRFLRFRIAVAAAFLAVFLLPFSARAAEKETPPSSGDLQLLAMHQAEARAEGKLTVESKTFGNGAAIPKEFTAYGKDHSPALRWSAPPDGTQSFVVIMEDPDAAEPKPFVHWLLYNISAGTRELPERIAKGRTTTEPVGALQGENSKGIVGYFGPKPPPWKTHRYHFQVFALNKKLELPPEANRGEILQAMSGNVLAQGVLVGTYQQEKNEQ